jgi:hypothetical protein
MAIFRGIGGAGDSTTDATVTAVTEQAVNAATSATQAASSASSAASSASSASTSATNAAASASTASDAATAASTSESNAQTSASNASTIYTNTQTLRDETETLKNETNSLRNSAATFSQLASGYATDAETAETNAETAETNAETAYANTLAIFGDAQDVQDAVNSASASAATATTKASEASASASNASTSETNSANSASSANTSATNASNSATAAAGSATDANTYKLAAQDAQVAAEAAQSQTENLFDQFGDQYLGSKASDPTVDNDGDPLTTGDIYWNSTSNTLRFYNGTAWVAPETIATNAAYSALISTVSAQTAQTAAETAQTAAETAETNAETAETNAAASASSASTSATNAANSATAASNSATAANNSASAAATSATNAENAYDSFDDRYLGVKASDPALDNDGAALLTGALYFNSTDNEMRVYTGSVWVAVIDLAGDVTVTSLTASGGDISFYNDSGTSQDFYWDASTSRLGIKTTSPSFDLHVKGNVNEAAQMSIQAAQRTGSDGASNASLKLETVARGGGANRDTSYEFLMTPNNNYGNANLTLKYRNDGVNQPDVLSIRTSGDIAFFAQDGTTSDFYWDKSTSRLGLGTTSPDTVMEVVSNDPILTIRDSSTALANASSTLRLAESAADDALGSYWDVALDGSGGTIDFTIGNNTSEAMRIDSLGNVGIGTTDPDSLFHISSGGPKITITDTSFNADATITVNDAGSLTFSADANNERTSSKIQFDVDGSEVARIDSVGRLGIGTTSPLSYIHIAQSAVAIRMEDTDNDSYGMILYNTADGGLRLRSDQNQAVGTSFSNIIFETDAAEAMRIDSSGNVGIGTTSPAAQLDVAATTGSVIRLTSTSTAVSADDPIGLLQFYGSDGSAPGAGVKSKIAAYAALGSGDGSYLTFSTSDGITNDIERMRIDSSGNLLVGTTSTLPGFGNTTTGHSLQSGGHVLHSRSGGTVAYLNRNSTDGTIVDFRKDGSTIGDMGSKDSDLYIRNGGVGLRFNDGGVSLMPAGSNGNAQDGTVFLGTSGARFASLFLSGGVYLGGTGAANLLDDYEEGTFTPVIEGTTSGSIASFNTQQASYVKVGDLVQIGLYLNAIDVSTSTISGNILIGGLPFSGDSFSGVANITYCDLFNFVESDVSITGYFTGTSIRLIKGSSTTSITDSDESSGVTGGSLMITLVYQI